MVRDPGLVIEMARVGRYSSANRRSTSCSILLREGGLSGDWYPGRLTQAKATFQDKDGPIEMQLGRAGQAYGRLLQGNQPYRMPAVSPGATGPSFHHQDDQPIGLQLGRDG